MPAAHVKLIIRPIFQRKAGVCVCVNNSRGPTVHFQSSTAAPRKLTSGLGKFITAAKNSCKNPSSSVPSMNPFPAWEQRTHRGKRWLKAEAHPHCFTLKINRKPAPCRCDGTHKEKEKQWKIPRTVGVERSQKLRRTRKGHNQIYITTSKPIKTHQNPSKPIKTHQNPAEKNWKIKMWNKIGWLKKYLRRLQTELICWEKSRWKVVSTSLLPAVSIRTCR